MARPIVADRRWALIGGLIGVLGGSWLLYQAYDARGRSRPLAMRMLPG